MKQQRIPHILYFWLIICCMGLAQSQAFAAPDSQAEIQKQDAPYLFEPQWLEVPGNLLPASWNVQTADNAFLLLLWLVPQGDYYTYAHSPLVARPVRIEQDEEAAAAGMVANVFYPSGTVAEDAYTPGKKVPLYKGRVPVFLLFDAKPQASFFITYSLLACNPVRCLPAKGQVKLLPPDEWVKAGPEILQPLQAFFTGSVPPMREDDEDTPPVNLAGNAVNAGNALQNIANQTSLTEAPVTLHFSPRPFLQGLEVQGIGKALILGFLAGLILNAMPCVLPILLLKVSGLLVGIQDDKEKGLKAFRQHNIFFALGIVVWFGALALVLGFADMVWGQLFQNAGLILGMLLLVFGLSLSLFDVFHLPVLDFRLSKGVNPHASPRSQAFLTGLLATLLATPCSGPLLGAVLGYSMSQGIAVLTTVFVATGIGMASPYLMMAVWPKFSKLLPRPGAWMLAFERLLGFFLLGTSLYLFSLLPVEQYIPALCTLLALAVALWIWGNWGSLKGGRLRRSTVSACCAALVLFVGLWAFTPMQDKVEWVPYTPQTFAERLGKENLLVEFTADWCPTCKVLEKTTLKEENMLKLTAGYPLTLMRVDMTREEAGSLALLRGLNSASIPLLAIFPASEPLAPVVLRDAYSFSQLEEAVALALK